MKLISWNVNGLRAVMGKGFMDVFTQLDADVFCLQETVNFECRFHSKIFRGVIYPCHCFTLFCLWFQDKSAVGGRLTCFLWGKERILTVVSGFFLLQRCRSCARIPDVKTSLYIQS